MQTEVNTAQELKEMVSDWVNKFNFIQLEVLEKMADGSLFEYIEQEKPDYDDFIRNYSLEEEYKQYLYDMDEADSKKAKKHFCRDHHSFDRYMDDHQRDNYPMWSTCFEFKEEESKKVLKAARKAGFGIIKGLEPFNAILFVSGAGYSFYSHHWIPMFLELPWNKDIKKQVIEKQINYDHI